MSVHGPKHQGSALFIEDSIPYNVILYFLDGKLILYASKSKGFEMLLTTANYVLYVNKIPTKVVSWIM